MRTSVYEITKSGWGSDSDPHPTYDFSPSRMDKLLRQGYVPSLLDIVDCLFQLDVLRE